MQKKLMIVDDSIFIWQEMKYMLADSGFDIVGCAKTGEEAVALYKKVCPDIVTMDIILPGEDGIETTKKLLQEFPEAKVVMVSSLAYDTTIEDAHKIGAFGFVFKPFERQQLLDALNSVFETV